MSRLPTVLILVALSASPLAAQVTTPPPTAGIGRPPIGAQAPATPLPGGSHIDNRPMPSQNVRIDVAITDTFGTAPTHKIVTLLVGDLRTGRIRSSLNVAAGGAAGSGTNPYYRDIGINVDATPEVRSDGRILLQLNVQYTPDRPDVAAGAAEQKPADINESLTTLFQDGKATLVSQSADPQSDRKVTLEVTATVVR
jgi:hypothetical protein